MAPMPTGSDRLLPGRYNHLQTDTCSTNREMMQFDRTRRRDGSDGVPGGMPDEMLSRELFNDEDPSHQSSEGLHTDAEKPSPDAPDETRFPPCEESTAYVACASDSDEQPAALHECLAVPATNPASKKSCRAVIMFDSGSSYSQVSSKLARFLDLPRQEKRLQHISIFGSETALAFQGFRTFLVLCSAQGRSIRVNVTVLDRIVSSVRTALVRDADLPALRSGDYVPTPTREMPDLLIGQDLVHLFDRQLDPTIPCGFYVVRTSMGPTIGGASLNVTPPLKAPSSSAPTALPAAEDTDIADPLPRLSLSSPPSMIEPPNSRLHLRLPELSAYRLAHTADGTAESPPDSLAYCLAHTADNTATCDTNECLGSSTSTTFASSQYSQLTRVLGALPQPSQKQLSINPLDAKPLLLPTRSTTYVDAEEIPLADNTAGPPTPIQQPLSSGEAELRCSSQPMPTYGNVIRASLNDAGSHLTRKTRLRCRLPARAWQTLGIYAAREPVAVTSLLPPRSTCLLITRADQDHQLILMSPLPQQITILLRINLIQCRHASHRRTVLLRNARAAVLYSLFRAAVLYGLLSNTVCQSAATSLRRMLERIWSYHETLRWLRSPCSLPPHARETSDKPPMDSAHPRPPARNAHTTDAECSQPQPTPQSLTSRPADPTPARLPPSLPLLKSGRVPPTSGSMVRSKNRKLKDYSFCIYTEEDYDDEHPGVIPDPNHNLRTTRPGDVQEVLVDEVLSAAPAAHPELRHPY